MKLVVLESPTKMKALSKYLGNEYKVLSSQGHITKLTNSGPFGLGIDLETFTPQFVVPRTKSTLLKNLKKAAVQANQIYLATDPDREGEAIAYHIQNRLGFPEKTQRVSFNEITQSAVLQAFKVPTQINRAKVESQFARRIIDRMIGYRLSKLLQKKIAARSAGRVQSITLRLVVDREQEILNFVPVKSWNFFAQVGKIKIPLVFYQGKTIAVLTLAARDQIQKALRSPLILKTILNKPFQQAPPRPLKTATLLQLAGNKLGFSAKKTMFVAQKLYEGINVGGTVRGFISYPRTDSERINPEFSRLVKSYIKDKFQQISTLSSHVSPTKNIQDAHEAIRVTDITMEPSRAKTYLNSDQHRLYNLIYQVTLGSFMQPATGIKRTYKLSTKENYEFIWEGKYLTSPGFTVLLGTDLPLGEKAAQFPAWNINQLIVPEKFFATEKESKPRPRFTEAQLIKRLEELAIGRPSTYSGLVSKLEFWNYLDKTERKLQPTSKGMQVNQHLTEHFSEFINEEYTAQMEQDLDAIAEGKKQRVPFLKEFWKIFHAKINAADDKMKDKSPVMLEEKCPDCESSLQERDGRYGKFIGCSNYPDCRYIRRTELQPELTGEKCPQCQKDLAHKKGKFGKFIACLGYPDCRYIQPNQTNSTPPKMLDRQCPRENCAATLVERKGKFGTFIACSRFPKCRYIEKTQKQK